MKRISLVLAICGFPFLGGAVACASPAVKSVAEAHGRVPAGRLAGPFPIVKITDGDTVSLALPDGQESVRLIGIDTPEKYAGRKLDADVRKSGRSKEELQALGRQASKITAGLLEGKEAWLELDVQERDRHGRLLGYVYFADAGGDWQYEGRRLRQVNLEIVRAGWAEPLTIPPNVRYQALYRDAARAAKEQRTGVWSQSSVHRQEENACEPLGKDCPRACPVKGNINRKGKKLFHVPGGEYYDRTIPEACFADPEAARAAGFTASQR